MVDERDVHGELAISLQELPRAVERIDQPESRPATAALVSGFGRFLGQDRKRRRGLQRAHDELVRSHVRGRKRRAIRLQPVFQRAGSVVLENQPAGGLRNRDDARNRNAHAATRSSKPSSERRSSRSRRPRQSRSTSAESLISLRLPGDSPRTSALTAGARPVFRKRYTHPIMPVGSRTRRSWLQRLTAGCRSSRRSKKNRWRTYQNSAAAS